MKAVLTEAEKQQDRMSNSFVQNRLRELRQQLESYYRSAVTLGAVLAEENLLGLMFHYYSKVDKTLETVLYFLIPSNLYASRIIRKRKYKR